MKIEAIYISFRKSKPLNSFYISCRKLLIAKDYCMDDNLSIWILTNDINKNKILKASDNCINYLYYLCSEYININN